MNYDEALVITKSATGFCPSRCKMLNLHRNHLVCLRQLPKLPAVEHLCLSENAISSLRGLGALGSSPLRSLNLTRNPVTFSRDYRAQWVAWDYNEVRSLEVIFMCCLFFFSLAVFSHVCQTWRSWTAFPSSQETRCPSGWRDRNPAGCVSFYDSLWGRMKTDLFLVFPSASLLSCKTTTTTLRRPVFSLKENQLGNIFYIYWDCQKLLVKSLIIICKLELC